MRINEIKTKFNLYCVGLKVKNNKLQIRIICFRIIAYHSCAIFTFLEQQKFKLHVNSFLIFAYTRTLLHTT